MKRQTWFGNLRRHLDDVWPGIWSLDWTRPVPFWVDGAPMASATVHLGRHFAKQRIQKRWLSRQRGLVQRRPPLTSQDYFLSILLRARGPWAHVFESGRIVDSDDDDEIDFQAIYESLPKNVIFPQIPAVQANVFKKLINTLAGKEDFARVTAHFSRREKFPFLDRRSDEDEDNHEERKRCCAYCYQTQGKIVLDSEWHSFFECPLTLKPRQRFFLTDTHSPDTHIHKHTQDVSDPLSLLVKLVLQSQSNSALLEALAYLSQDIYYIRRTYFRRLNGGP